jgi:hypothetical protein
MSPCERRKKYKDEHQPLEIKGARGKCCSPQVGEALLPLPRGFRGVAVAPDGAAVALTGASAVLAGSSTKNPVAGASAHTTGANSTATSAACGDGGGGIHLSGGGASLSSSSSFDDEFAGVPRGESPCCSRSRYSSLCCSRRLILLSFDAWRVGGCDRATSTVTLC